jgi:hypothetical protein
MAWDDMSVNASRPPVGVWVAYAAALWAAVFAVFHIIWAAGWYPLLDAEATRIAFANPWKWAFDVVVAGMCVVAVPVALAPVRPWGQRLPQGIIYGLACIGSALLDLRLAAALVQTGYLVVVGRFRFAIIGIWDWWFVLGAILFSVSTWRWSCTRPRRGAA